MSPRRPGLRAKKGDGPKLRGQIVEATTKLLLDTGDENAVSIRAVAEAVGVTPPSIYLHFRDKDELIFECARQLMGKLTAELIESVPAVEDPVLRLRMATQRFVQFGVENPEPYRVTFLSPHHHVPAGYDASADGAAGAFNLLILLTASITGRPVDDRALVVRSMSFFAAIHGTVALLIAKVGEPLALPWPEQEALVDDVLDMFLASLDDLDAAGSR